ncbi:ester hydrolase C11orf54 homolog [Ornithodoros turicata]|uniref:ester hydrolase C11orf54 homolog n=1 Tax=Ornithodoros turicata TaxID=34597 RepID=UPI003138D1FE
MASLDVKKHTLYTPSLEEVAKVLNDGLKGYFKKVDVAVTDCPDLRRKPFMLASEGICGRPRLSDVGGVPYLIPMARTEKIYSINDVMKCVELPDGFVIGAGAGPHHIVGVNCEMMHNMKCGPNAVSNTHYAKIEDEKCALGTLPPEKCEFCLMANLLVSEGKPGKVLRVSAKHRIGEDNFVNSMRKILNKKYGANPVGLGGVFVIQQGKAKLHVMPHFSETPLVTNDDVNKWLKFFNMSAPLVCLSTFLSHDPGWDLRIEHTHCFSDHGEGGHYHYDVTPTEVEYLGYFNIAEFMYRIDAPTVTHSIGRD